MTPNPKSPYEPTAMQPPLPDESPWNARLSMLWFVILAVAGAVLTVWTFFLPLWT